MIDYISLIYMSLISPLDQKIEPLSNKIIAFFTVIDIINKKLKTLDFDFTQYVEFYFDDGLELIISQKRTSSPYPIKVLHFSDLLIFLRDIR